MAIIHVYWGGGYIDSVEVSDDASNREVQNAIESVLWSGVDYTIEYEEEYDEVEDEEEFDWEDDEDLEDWEQ